MQVWAGRGWNKQVLIVFGVLAQIGARLEAETAVLELPCVVLLYEHGADEADDRGFVREDAGDKPAEQMTASRQIVGSDPVHSCGAGAPTDDAAERPADRVSVSRHERAGRLTDIIWRLVADKQLKCMTNRERRRSAPSDLASARRDSTAQ